MSQIPNCEFVSCIPLPTMASSASTARMHTRTVLNKWHMPDLTEDAELVVSELVTNAIRATNILASQARYPEIYDHMGVVCLCLQISEGDLLIEVQDLAQNAPRLRRSAPDDEGGRGLLLVTTIAREWGCRKAPTGGEIVWARLARDGTTRSVTGDAEP
jgi:Anti-sigma regulatory factor (Ser/Thr protein kinase)